VQKYIMLRHFLRIRHSTQQRAMYIVCMCFVLSYIAFNILDLDGSNLRSFVTPMERSSIVGVIPPDLEIPYSSDRVEHVRTIAALVADIFTEYARRQTTRIAKSSPLGNARAHGYRIGLARDDLPD
jgi:hypothetical protein